MIYKIVPLFLIFYSLNAFSNSTLVNNFDEIQALINNQYQEYPIKFYYQSGDDNINSKFIISDNGIIDYEFKSVNKGKIFNQCIKLSNLKFNINKSYKFDTNSFLKKFDKECLTINSFNKIILSLEKYFLDKGFIVDIKILKNNKIQTIEFDIKFKRILKIVYEKNDFFNNINKFTAFGFYNNRILKIEDLDQAINQINRLNSNNAKIKIVSDNLNNDQLIIYVDNQKKFPISSNISYDNLGNNFTGKNRLLLNISIDDIFKLNENININLTTNSDFKNEKKGIRSINTNISLPLFYYLITYDFSRSDYNHQFSGDFTKINFSGYSQKYSILAEKLLHRNKDKNINLVFSLSNKTSANYLNKQKIITSQRNITTSSFGFNYNISNKDLVLKTKFNYYNGIRLLGAQNDKKQYRLTENSNYYPKSQYSMIKIVNHFNIKKLINLRNNFYINLGGEYDYQYTKQKLYGIDQLSVGGYNSIRSFNENFLSGDIGYILRNKINFRVCDILNLFQNDNLYSNIILNRINLDTFYDYGYSRNNYSYEKRDGRLSGLGFKLGYNSKNFSLNYTNSWSLSKSKLLNEKNKENYSTYFEISLSI